MEDYEPIISEEEMRKNRERAILKDSKKVKKCKLKKWVRNLLLVILGAFLGIIIYQIFTVTEVNTNQYGTYTCHGGKVLKICEYPQGMLRAMGEPY